MRELMMKVVFDTIIILRGIMFNLAYVYPAYQCFKSCKMDDPSIEQLLFWCRYGILVIALTICENIASILTLRVASLGEAKMALLIYLWHHKTKGTTYAYESFLRPCISRHEMKIDLFVLVIKRAGDGARRGLLKFLFAHYKKLNKSVNKLISMMSDENGARREIWLMLATFTWFISFLMTVALDPTFHKFMQRLIQQLWKLETLNGVKEWIIEGLIKQVGENGMDIIILSCLYLPTVLAILFWYAELLCVLADSEKSSRIHLKLTPKARCFCESMFVVTCAVMTHRIEDNFVNLFARCCACFHVIPLVNLIGVKDIFGFVDCLMAVVVEVGLCIGKQCPNYAPLVIAIVLILAFYLKDH